VWLKLLWLASLLASLVMCSLRCARISDALHERYDLKGSWVNRHRERIEKGQYVRCRYCSLKFEYSDSYVRHTLCFSGSRVPSRHVR
jgi:DNA-directed RNA polymerase subunit RPC12/RpoP